MKIFLQSGATIAAQMFDYYFAYRQAKDPGFRSDVDFVSDFTAADKTATVLSIMHADSASTDAFDLILIDNFGESLSACTDSAAVLLQKHNAYFLCSSYVPDHHPLYDKIIPYNHNHQLFVDTITRRFYPQYHHLRRNTREPKEPMVFINGANRAWRHYFTDLMRHSLQDQICIKNSVKSRPSKILDCQFESQHDTDFRVFCNDNIAEIDDQEQQDLNYYHNSYSVGSGEKFGRIPPGYFFISEYFDFHCVIYPETSWLNHDFMVTEKTWKCFAAGAIPWPIAGAGFNHMMNQFGYETAWNLLPEHLQPFDHELDHALRYQQQIEALAWATQNPEIWHSARADQIRHNNKHRLIYNASWDLRTFTQLDKILL